MNTVFILGAGASREAGGPLMSDFLDIAARLLRERNSDVLAVRAAFDDVFTAIAELRGVYAKSHLDLDNIESVFGAIEMGAMLGTFANRDEESIKRLRDSVITLILTTLEQSIAFRRDRGAIKPPTPYEDFVAVIRKAVHSHNEHRVSLLTFNYDVSLDYAIPVVFSHPAYDYGLTADIPRSVIPLLKLHGSMNWGTCQQCKNIVPAPVFPLRADFAEATKFAVSRHLDMTKHCDKPLQGPAIIVPPTWSKGRFHEQLGNVWRHAGRRLRVAENIFVIGFSLPETDTFFRYLFALGTEGPARIERFWVFDPDDTGAVEKRFRALIGRGIESRFRYFPERFSAAIGEIAQVLGQP